MATKWKRFSRSGAFKAALVVSYIICTAAAGVVTGYGGAFVYDRLKSDGMELVFEKREEYERTFCNDELLSAMRECGAAYDNETKYFADFGKIVGSVPFGLSITDDGGKVYSNSTAADDIKYKVTVTDSEVSLSSTISELSIGGLDGYYNNESYVYEDENEKAVPRYDMLADLVPFAMGVETDTGVFYSDFADERSAVHLTLTPVEQKKDLNAETVYLTLWADSMSPFLVQKFPDSSVYRTALDGLDFYCRITLSDGTVVENGVPFSRTVDYDYSCDDFLPLENITEAAIGLSESQSAELSAKYENGVHDMKVIIITDIGLAVLSTAILIFLCSLIGETPDGERKLSPVLSVFYEIPFAALIAAGAVAGANFLNDFFGTFSAVSSLTTCAMKIVFTGVSAAAVSIIWLYLWLCISARSKNGTSVRGSLICRAAALLYKAVRGTCVFAKNLFLGRMIRGGAAKRMLWTDAAFITVTIINALLFVAASSGRVFVLSLLFLSLEVIFAGIFLYARFSLIHDVSKLERQIEDAYLGKEVSAGIFSERSPFRQSGERMEKLGEQYRLVVEERVKAERMKVDLVTNVSHDLKTPLTSIISYIDLLGREELPQTAADYVEILQNKAERLKNIVSDVFDLAKTTSGEITAESAEIDLAKLSCQALADMEDKISASGFEVRQSICDPPVTVMSDGKKIYRIIQNLMDNALKYSMEGTRIFYTLEKKDGCALITIKNISAVPMNFTAEEITERFVRGDKSRSSEGSGLGLSIAQGFALACGGRLDINIDGDMFSASVVIPLIRQN